MHPIKVCVWATTLQANVYTLARYLDGLEDFEVVVVAEDAAGFLREPVNRLIPFPVRLLERDDPLTMTQLRRFAPDVTLVDNNYPPRAISPAYVVVWHGVGWRGPEDRKSFATPFRQVKRLTGRSPERPNPRFRWICAGPTDFSFRKEVTGIAPENLRICGMAYMDDIQGIRLDRDAVLRHYPDAFRGRRVMLLAFTWHYGRMFSHWGEDREILETLFAFLERREVAVILRLHDRKRFEPEYLAELERLAQRHPGVLLKYKDEHRDNLLDILVSDLAVSNYSSILTYFYATGRPSIHVYPISRSPGRTTYRVWKGGRVRSRKAPSSDYIWSLSPEEHGGLAVDSPEALLTAIETALEVPGCCRERSRAFISRHLTPLDGGACRRAAEVLRELGPRRD